MTRNRSMADTQSNENNDDDGKPEELLFEILKEVDGFFEQEDRQGFPQKTHEGNRRFVSLNWGT